MSARSRPSAADEPSVVAIVINPSKFDDPEATKAEVRDLVLSYGWGEPLWFETTKEDSGTAAAEEALTHSPDLVCAMGGDGTVRAVASVLRGGSVPYGILPSGTGNLLARNLGIPFNSLPDAVEIALKGQDHGIDVGLATFDDGVERVFMVMSGVGLDATIMDKTDDELKKKMGWGAYVVAGGANLFGGGFEATVTVGDESESSQKSLMVLACNCSSVVANIELAPGARVDDGQLDLVLLRPNVIAGWLGVAIDVAVGNRNGLASLRQWAGPDATFELDRPVLAELDGDPVGETQSGRFGVDPGALICRLPVPAKHHPGLRATKPTNDVVEDAPKADNGERVGADQG
ncbi:diacylglycerol/lipid kinase family protein [Naasia lichenicola]|uniref:Diacylglycerol kinase n=1 Tax=Naasia lichenicola TaxID=2565933 RepID=A0A4S4FHX1_9MICO|nr:diacylglycerol kinase family protein [Naasia lichenicola]THG29900.1 diacylglycerol kinase [Naasia lichenicola]